MPGNPGLRGFQAKCLEDDDENGIPMSTEPTNAMKTLERVLPRSRTNKAKLCSIYRLLFFIIGTHPSHNCHYSLQ